LLYKRKSILTKKLLFLQTVNIIIIKTKTIKTKTEITETITKTTETLVIIKYTDNLIITADSENIIISVKKRIVNYKNIQTKNRQKQKRFIKTSLITI
jgi:hypothetical protein